MTKRLFAVFGACALVYGCGSTATTPGTGNGGGGTTTLPLAVTCPAAVSTSTAAATVAVSYAPPAATGGTQPVTASCTPVSGSQFARGTNTVTCTATDAVGKVATCSFAITVQSIPVLKGTRFLAFGDSITAGEVLNAIRQTIVNPAKSYPTLLEALLNSRYIAQVSTVQNYGQSGEVLMNDLGYRSEETASRYNLALTAQKPDAVLLLEGANDFNSPNITDDQIAEVLRQMVREAYLAKAKAVYLATLTPQIPGLLRSSQAARVPTLNAKIRVIAQQEGATLVDIYAAMIGNVTNLINADDGLHPYPAGYAAMADTFNTAIKATFEQSSLSTLNKIK